MGKRHRFLAVVAVLLCVGGVVVGACWAHMVERARANVTAAEMPPNVAFDHGAMMMPTVFAMVVAAAVGARAAPIL